MLLLACTVDEAPDSVVEVDTDTDADTDTDSDSDTDADSDTDSDTDADLITAYAWAGHIGVGELASPRGVAVMNGRLVVADTGNGRLAEFDLDGAFVGSIGEDVLSSPKHVAFDAAGDLWTADTSTYEVFRFGSEDLRFSGDFLETYAALGVADEAYVADYGQDRVVVTDLEGAELRVIGDSVELDKPSGLLVVEERLYVASTGGDVVRVYEAGTLIDTLGAGVLNDPHQLALDPDGSIWVADQFNWQVVKLSPEGEVLTSIGERGSEDGQVDWPFGVAVAPDRRIFVADMRNDRISVWAPE